MRSTPKTDRTPAVAVAFAKRTAPVTLFRSVSAGVPIPRSVARAVRALGGEVPKRAENPLATCRCGTPPPMTTSGQTPMKQSKKPDYSPG
ncbi:hypothetical protein BN2537_17121 [Streptomyces venezuelae]|nr:hypothetical protein BN2537_17121 [Streptomyces venezuelae]